MSNNNDRYEGSHCYNKEEIVASQERVIVPTTRAVGVVGQVVVKKNFLSNNNDDQYEGFH